MRQILRTRWRRFAVLALGLAVLLSSAVATLALGPGGLLAQRSADTSPTPSSSAAAEATPVVTESAAPTAAPTPTPSATPTCIDVGNWPVAQRLNQLIMVSGDFSNLGASAPYATAGVGGFVFFGQPPAGSGPAIRSGLAALFNDAREAGMVSPWTSTDEEGGYVARLANVVGAMPTPQRMASIWTPAQLQSVITAHAGAMWNLGITMDLAPVLDTSPSTNTIGDEGDRSFSFDPRVAAAYGVAYAIGLRAGNVVAVGKHFPGFGQASGNTDLGPATDPPLSELESRDLIPFEQAIAQGLPVIMVTHASVPGLTGTVPASLSPATYQYLRNRLHFTGVTITDALNAGAINALGYGQPAAAVKAIESGADMVMIDAGQWQATLAALQRVVDTAAFPLSALHASVNRILTAKGLTVCSS